MWRRLPTFRKWNLGQGAKGAEIEKPQASRGWRMGRGFPLSSRLRGLGERRELPQRGPGQSPNRKRIWGILSVAERLWLKENQVFRETFITAYTSTRTVTGHQLAKIALFIIQWTQRQRSKAKTGNKEHWHSLLTLLFCSVKIRDISLSQTEPFGTRDTASEFRIVPTKNWTGWQPYMWPLKFGYTLKHIKKTVIPTKPANTLRKGAWPSHVTLLKFGIPLNHSLIKQLKDFKLSR